MATQLHGRLSNRMRARGLRAAGIAIILLSAGAALLPAGKEISSDMIGGLLIAAGLIEAVAGSLRSDVRPFAIAAGVVTTLAGLLFVLNPETHFFPTVTIVIAWLLIRSLILAAASTESFGIRSHFDRAFGGNGLPSWSAFDRRPFDYHDHCQHLWTNGAAHCELCLVRSCKLRHQRASSSRSRKL